MLIRLSALILCAALPTRADAPRVVADIAPVHSLVAMVMEGVAAPDLILAPGVSPHSYAMRPSEAAALERAEVVVWIGPALTPWLEGPIATLAGDAEVLSLLAADGTVLLGLDEDDHDHGHDEIDPHAWLDPENARHWLSVVAGTLSVADPENAETYRANAASAADTIANLRSDMAETLAPLHGKPYAVYHDAYRYLEDRFGLGHLFAITSSHAVSPGPSRIAEMRELARESDVKCVFIAQNESGGLIETVFAGTQVRTQRVDPVGADSAPGPLLYLDLMHRLAQDLGTC